VSSGFKREPYFTAENHVRCLKSWFDEIESCPGRKPLPDLSNAWLLVLDLQNLFIHPKSPAFLPGWKGAAPQLQRLLNTFRNAHRNVIWTRHSNDEADDGGIIRQFGGKAIPTHDPLSTFVPEFSPAAGEPIIEKNRYSPWKGFAEKCDQARPVVLAGVQLNRCVLATAVEAASEDRVCIVAADACATYNNQLHTESLRILAGGFSYVASVNEIILELEGKPVG